MKVHLKNLRMAFPALFEPDSFNDGAPAYGARFIIPSDHPAVKVLDDAIAAVAKEKWKVKAEAIVKKATADGNVAFNKSEYTNAEGDVYDGFEDAYWLQSRNEVQPGIYDRDRAELSKKDGRPYSGCFVNAQVDIWAQDNKFGKGVRCKLLGVQFLRDGDAFAGGTKAKADDFDDLSDIGEEEDDSDLA